MSTAFANEYDTINDYLSKIKPQFESLDQAISSLSSIKSNDEIQSLAEETSTVIVEAQMLIHQHKSVIESLQSSITTMGEDEEKKSETEREKEHYKEQMRGTDGKTKLPLDNVSLLSLLSSKELRYNCALKTAYTRVSILCPPTHLAPPPISAVPTPSVITAVNSHPLSSGLTVVDQNADSSSTSNENISSLTSSISQLVNLVSSNSQSHIKIEPFDGSDITRWPAFRYQLDKLVLGKDNLSNAEKGFLVRSSLKGHAFSLIASLPIHNENFLDMIMSRLTKKFGDHSLTQAKLLQSLHSIKPKSSQTIDQLSAVQSLINIAHTIDEKCGIDSLDTQQQIAGRINSRFIDLIWDQQPKTLLSALELIEDSLEKDIRRATLREAYSSRIDHSAQSPASTSHSKPNRGPQPSGNASSRTANGPSGIAQSPHNTTGSAHLPKGSNKPLCVYCEKHMFSTDCTQVTSIPSRKTILDKKSLCHSCFSSSHASSECQKSCSVCKAKHHRSLCDKATPTQRSPVVGVTVSPSQPIQVNTRLFTAPIVVTNPDSRNSSTPAMANVLLDTGAQVSLISRDLATRLCLSPVGQMRVNITGLTNGSSHSQSPSPHDVVRLSIATNAGPRCVNAIVRDTESIISTIQLQPLSSTDLKAIESTLSHIPHHFTQSSVSPDLLLSVDETLKLLDHSQSTRLPCGYRLIQSIIGPLVVGSEDIKPPNNPPPSLPLLQQPSERVVEHSPSLKIASVVSTPEESLEHKVERMFAVDPIARVYETTEKESRKADDEMVSSHFDSTVERREDGYYVQYAVKGNAIADLPDNHDLAVSRLASTVRSLSKDRKLIEFYDSVIKDQISLGQVELVDPADTSGIIHYLAHQAVLRPDKPSTPLRIVYDASAHLKGKPSLNDMIFPGPSDLEHIPALLLRSRSRRCLIIADVEKAFLQVKLCPSQRNMLRFLWLKDINKPVSQHNLLILRFCVTPFGVNQSPCLLNKVITHHIQNHSHACDARLVRQLVTNIYVDNIVINVDTPLTSMYTESKHLFNEMAMNLRDYASNDQSFIESIPESDRSKDVSQKLLGLRWDTSQDTISLSIPISEKAIKESKRSMLSTVASAYDPLGLLNPLLLPPRLTVQNLWNEDLKWDEQVNESTRISFHNQILEVEKFTLSLDRYAYLSDSSQINLIAFSDASMHAMATCVYSWAPNRQPTLLISKTRLAPIKSKSTIPKMELESLAMSHTLLLFTVETLRKEFPDKPITVHSYSDSAIALHWCKPGFNKSVGVLVANRVKQIHTISEQLTALSPLTYHPPRHVRSECNPADHATRGLSSSEMNDPSHQWWVGPPWLQNDPSQWPNESLSSLNCQPIDTFYPVTSPVVSGPVIETIIDLTRFSSLKKAINVTSLVYRFIARIASKTNNTSLIDKLSSIPHNRDSLLSSAEKRFAMCSIIRLHQMKYVTDDDSLKKKHSLTRDHHTGLLRVNTRLSNADLPSDFKSPVYIPTSADSSLARLLIRDMHCSSNHASIEIVLNSLKSRFFVPRARALVKSVLKQCLPCRKTNNLPYRYPETVPLPQDRVRQSLPFEHCGLDYAGPFHTKEEDKQWIVLFTCFSSRLTHIEVVPSLLPSSFILAFKRFCSRRGTPLRITSDKATTLKMASTLISANSEPDPELNTLFTSLGVSWSFTSAHSPWKGGVYERLIKVVKETLSRSIGKRKLSKEEFSTIMCEIEALLNSRPLSYISSDDNLSFSLPVLRPIDIILPESFLGCSLNLISSEDEYLPPDEQNCSRNSAIKQLIRSISVVDSFWKRWNTEYLSSLRDSSSRSDPLHSSRSCTTVPRCGSIVLVIDESGNTPRSSWKMAKILSLSDTAATLRSHAGRIIERPINLLIPLELHSDEAPIKIEDEYYDSLEDDLLAEERFNPPARISDVDDIKGQLEDMKKTFKHSITMLTHKIEDVGRFIESLNPMWKATAKDVSSLSLEVSKLATPHQPYSAPVIVTPRSKSQSTRAISFNRTPSSRFDRASTSRDRSRSRSPIHSRSHSGSPKVPACTFCSSIVHFSRHCSIVTSLATRQAIMAANLDICQRCFRFKSHGHSPKCEPDVCKRGCKDKIGRPERHMDYFCPQNPDLTEYRHRSNRHNLRCVNGEGNCKNYTKGIYTCRKCRMDRFEAVIAAGRTGESIQSLEAKTLSSSSSPDLAVDLSDRASVDFNTAMQCPSTEINASRALQSPSIIDRISSNHRVLSIMRRTAEFQLRGIDMDPFEADREEYELAPCTYGIMNEATRILITGLIEFIPAIFPKFSELSLAEKWLLIRNYQKTFHILDSLLRSHRRWGSDVDVLFGSYTTYLSSEAVDIYFSDCPNQKNVADAARTLRDCILENCEKTKKQLGRVMFTEEEYLALIGIAFWSVENFEPNEQLMELASRYRAEILSDLIARYRQTIGVEEGTIRIGELHCILLAVKKAELNLKWEYEIYRILNVFDDNTYMYKMQLHRADIESSR